jgi:serine/threonine kinase PknH
MGSVHRAISKNDNKPYAVKVLPRRSMWNVRLARRQVRSFSQFSHGAVVPFVDVGTSGGLHYLVWNFVEGETLEALVQRLGKLDSSATAYLGLQLAAGLGQAHQHGLFHGLIKPSNVMLSVGQVSLLDFGIGSLLAENEGESLVDTMSTANTLTSGLDCASPESIMEPTNRTPAGDQYSLGCVLYYCLTGRYPFAEGSAVEKMMAHQFKQPASLKDLAPDAPDELVKIVEKLMQKKPEDRYQTVDEAHEALTALAPSAAPEVLAGTGSQALTQTPFGGGLTTKTGLSGVQSASAAAAPARPASMESMRLPAMPMTGAPAPATFAPSPGGAAIPAARASMRAQMSPRASMAGPPPAANPRASMAGNPRASMTAPAAANPRASMAGPPAANPRGSIANPAGMNLRALMANSRATTASMVDLQLPPPADVYQMEPPPPQAQPQIITPDTGEPKPMLGPLGFIAIGAVVAVACFLVVHNLLK